MDVLETTWWNSKYSAKVSACRPSNILRLFKFLDFWKHFCNRFSLLEQQGKEYQWVTKQVCMHSMWLIFFKCYSCLLYNFTRLHSCDWFAWLHCTKHVAFLCVTFNNSFSQHLHNRNTHQVTGRLQPSWHTPAWMVSDSQLCLQANITHWKLDLLHEASINFG